MHKNAIKTLISATHRAKSERLRKVKTGGGRWPHCRLVNDISSLFFRVGVNSSWPTSRKLLDSFCIYIGKGEIQNVRRHVQVLESEKNGIEKLAITHNR